ncbi:MAG: DUF3467 domain-containing protein [Planctomycetota bacterium]|nr:DUF3467 domain-containing protein [Planctomycetota bacterium]
MDNEIPEKPAEGGTHRELLNLGLYSNVVRIAHSRFEFLLDFGQVTPEHKEAVIKARIIMSPHHAKALSLLLTQKVKEYEDKNGPLGAEEGMDGLFDTR